MSGGLADPEVQGPLETSVIDGNWSMARHQELISRLRETFRAVRGESKLGANFLS